MESVETYLLPCNANLKIYCLPWGHRDFETVPRQDDIWVLHGHTIVGEPFAQAGRIAIDTGAYATGLLTAAYVTMNEAQFIQN